MDLSSFRERRPAFAHAATVGVRAALNGAGAPMSARAWGGLYEAALMWLAAHILSLGPNGHGARNEANPSTGTTYKTQYDDLVPKATCCYGTVP